MGLFSSGETNLRYGAVVEIGSGSVMASIVQSDLNKDYPNVIWAKREFVPTKTYVSNAQAAKNIMTSLMNAVMLIDSEGRREMSKIDKSAKLRHLQISVTAPWSYTITKTISYEQDVEQTITKELFESLVLAAQKKVTEELKENELANDLGLTVIARATTDVQANGYKTSDPVGKVAKNISLTQISAVSQTYLTDYIKEVQSKVFPRTQLEKISFMLMFHCVIRDFHEQITEYCLVDLTFEATEIGIVRNGILQYCTHVPIGINTIARELSATLNIPFDEAKAFLKEPYHTTAMAKLSPEQLKKVEVIFDEYQDNLSALFKETGDTLTIPKVLFLHGNHQTEPFFCSQIISAAKKSTHLAHTVYGITTDFLTKSYGEEQRKALLAITDDTALLVAAQFFHKKHHCNDFIQT